MAANFEKRDLVVTGGPWPIVCMIHRIREINRLYQYTMVPLDLEATDENEKGRGRSDGPDWLEERKLAQYKTDMEIGH